MRILETKLYGIDELSGEAKKHAIEETSRHYIESESMFTLDEIINTANEIAEAFDMRITNYSVGFFDRRYIDVDNYRYMEQDNETKNAYVKWINENMKAGVDGACQFTGVCWDAYFFDALMEYEEITYNNFHKIVPQAIEDGVVLAIRSIEDASMDNELMYHEAVNNGLEFYEDGSIYV